MRDYVLKVKVKDGDKDKSSNIKLLGLRLKT